MVATFFAWLVPLLMMPVGALVWIAAALADEIAYARDLRIKVALWGGPALVALGAALTVINIWELF